MSGSCLLALDGYKSIYRRSRSQDHPNAGRSFMRNQANISNFRIKIWEAFPYDTNSTSSPLATMCSPTAPTQHHDTINPPVTVSKPETLVSRAARARVGGISLEKEKNATNPPPIELRPTASSSVTTRKVDRPRFRGPMRGSFALNPSSLPRMRTSTTMTQKVPLQERVGYSAQATCAERGRAQLRELTHSSPHKRRGGASLQRTRAYRGPNLIVPIARSTAQAEAGAEERQKSFETGLLGDMAESPTLLDSDGDDLYDS